MLDSVSLKAATQPDSTKVNLFEAAFRSAMYYDLAEAEAAVDSMQLYAERSGNGYWIAKATNCRGSYYFLKGQVDSALVYYRTAIEQYRLIDNAKEVSGVLINVANCLGEQGKLDASMATHMSSLRLQDSLGIRGRPKAINLLNIGVLHNDLKDYKEALSYYKTAREIFEELDDATSVAEVEFNISLVYFDLDSLPKAQALLDKLEAFHRDAGNVYALTDVLLESGKNRRLSGDLAGAEDMLLEALQLATNNEDEQVLGTLYNKLAGLYLQKEEYAKAEQYSWLSYQAEQASGSTIYLISDLENLSDLYARKGDFQRALDFHKQYHALSDSLLNVEKLNFIEELKEKYEAEQREKDIQILKANAQKDKAVKYGLIIGMALLVLALAIAIYAFRQRLLKNKIKEEKLDQELAFNVKELELRKQELTAYALQLAHKNETLEKVKTDVADLGEYNRRAIQSIVNTINLNKNDDESWEGFRKRFTSIHRDFESTVQQRYPTVTPNELRLMSLLKMNLSNKEIANILNISADGIKKARYRLRKKLALKTGESLENLVLSL